jgi:hypothetical protein
MGIALFFSILFFYIMFNEPQTWSPTAVEKLQIIFYSIFILFNPPYLTVGSRLILIQIKL